MIERLGRLRERSIALRDVAPSDLPVLFDHQRDPTANDMAAFPARSHDAFMEHWTRILNDDTVVTQTVDVNGKAAGHVVSWLQGDKRLVGYWLGQKHWGSGIATYVLSEFLRVVTIRPLYAHVAQHNVASIRVLEKCGFGYAAEETAALCEFIEGIKSCVYMLGNTVSGS